jgi:outer membrane protein assembly factor BamB
MRFFDVMGAFRRAGFFSGLAALWLANAVGAQAQDNWPRWRGPGDNGSTARGAYPVKWDATNVLWKAPLPGKGCSTPAVWDKRIFLTAPINGSDAVLAYDWAGNRLWDKTLGPGQAGKRQNSSGCNPSPATDGSSVFVHFKSGSLAALDFDGHLRWQTNLVAAFGPVNMFWDQGTSPVLTKNAVVLARMHHGDSWLAAFGKTDGKLLWKVARNYQTAVEGDNSYTTPILIRQQGQEALLAWGGEHLTANAAADGRLLWSCAGFNPRAAEYWPTVASPIVVDDIAVVPAGRADQGRPRLHGIRLGGAGDVTATHRVWEREDTGTFVPTPVEYQGRIYLLGDRGEIQCLDPATGKTLWRQALPKGTVNYYASPTIAAGKLYAAREDGVVFVARIDGEFELLAENRLEERLVASPVPVSNRLLLRGERHLFCVEGRN